MLASISIMSTVTRARFGGHLAFRPTEPRRNQMKRNKEPAPAAAKPADTTTWRELNIALNSLVKEGVIASYKASRGDAASGPAVEVATVSGADQAEVVRRVRELLGGSFSGAAVRTRAV